MKLLFLILCLFLAGCGQVPVSSISAVNQKAILAPLTSSQLAQKWIGSGMIVEMDLTNQSATSATQIQNDNANPIFKLMKDQLITCSCSAEYYFNNDDTFTLQIGSCAQTDPIPQGQDECVLDNQSYGLPAFIFSTDGVHLILTNTHGMPNDVPIQLSPLN